MNCVHCGAPVGDSPYCNQCGKPNPARVVGGGGPTHVPIRPDDVLEGKWRLERKLGEGGMGTVYLAHDLLLDRKVAIKLLAPALTHDQELVTRFEREARLTAGLEHPNIVAVYAVGRADGRPFMVMKALEGRTLGMLLREKGALQKEELVPIFRQLAAGLDFIHQQGFIHRDIKAGNIFVGSAGLATILDFGILRPSRNAEQITKTGMVMGTPQYMSPEQALGLREIDARSDLYALAVLLFECLSGMLPFESDNDLSIIQMQAHAPPPDLLTRAPWLPRSVGDVLNMALAKNPAHRYPTAATLVNALEIAWAGHAAPSPDLERATPAPADFPMPPPAPGEARPWPSRLQLAPAAPGASGPKVAPNLASPIPDTAVSMSVRNGRGGSSPSLAPPGSLGRSGPKMGLVGPPPGDDGDRGATAFIRTPHAGSMAPAPLPLSNVVDTSGPSTAELARGLRTRRAPVVGGIVVAAAMLGAVAFYFVGGAGRSADVPVAPVAVAPAVATPPVAPDAAVIAEAPTALPVEDPGTSVTGVEPLPTEDTAVPDGGEELAAGDEDVEEGTEPVPEATTTTAAATVQDPKRTPRRTGLGHGPGKLNVITTHRGEPYWAKVMVDGEKKGTTPVLLELTAGRHRVRLERVGFRSVERQIKIASGRSAVLRIELIP